MNEDEFAALRAWGEGLRSDARDELRAAGKAILLLADEVERLQIALWHARRADPDVWDFDEDEERASPSVPSLAEAGDGEDAPEATEELHGRLRRLLRLPFHAGD